MSDHIKGNVVVITGASVVLGARRGKALAVAMDVTASDQVKKLVEAAVETYGCVDAIINNAGLMPQSLLERLKVMEISQFNERSGRRGSVIGLATLSRCGRC